MFSLDDAIEKAKATDRIVILKPVSFRSENENDALSPSSEAQRAIAFVDSRVVNLLNLRFVPYYFDVDPIGSQYDERAKTLAERLLPEMRYITSMPTPPLLFMTSEGKMLGHASNFLSAQELLDQLVEILDDQSKRSLTTEEQKTEDPVQRAWLLYKLRKLDDARTTLDKQLSSESYYLQVLIAREKEDWKLMKYAIDMVTDTHRKFDIDVENMLRYWQFRNLSGIKALGDQVGIDNHRYQEAMYYLGLAYYHTNDSTKAINVWRNAIENNRNSAWAFRLDLIQGLVKLNPRQYLSSQDVIPSVLGRTYMCPNGSDDLADQK